MSVKKLLPSDQRETAAWSKTILSVTLCVIGVMFLLITLRPPVSQAQSGGPDTSGEQSAQSDKRSVIGTASETSDAPAARPAGTEAINAIANGDFEQGHVAWTEFSSHGWDIISNAFPGTVTPHSGAWASWLGGEYDDISSLQQQVAIPAGQPSLVYYHWIGSQDDCGYDYAGVLINSTVVDSYTLCSAVQTGGWVTHSVSLAAYAGQTVTLTLQVETDSSFNSNLFVDDVSIVAQFDASKYASETYVRPGGTLTYTILLSNTSDSDLPGILVTDTLPSATYYLTDTLWASSGLISYDPAGGTLSQPTIYWSGVVSQHTTVSITFGVSVAVDLPNLTPITNTAQINYEGSLLARSSTIRVGDVHQVYLPLIMKRWPPIPDVPVLNAIANSDGDGNYSVTWNSAYLADTYLLQEDTSAAFANPITRYSGTGVSWSATGKSAGTYYYRVKASNSWGDSGWSSTQSVTVIPPVATRYWSGTTNQGQPMSFEVSLNGASWTLFTLKAGFSMGGCSGTIIMTTDGPGSITNGQFSYTMGTYGFSGRFTSATNATGSYFYQNYYIPNCGYLTQSGTWTATRQ
jgi:uncharacterized repeat protein (TIGR01451 family)